MLSTVGEGRKQEGKEEEWCWRWRDIIICGFEIEKYEFSAFKGFQGYISVGVYNLKDGDFSF